MSGKIRSDRSRRIDLSELLSNLGTKEPLSSSPAHSPAHVLTETASGRVLVDAAITGEILAVAIAGFAVKGLYVDMLIGHETFARYLVPILLVGLLQYQIFLSRGLYSARSMRVSPDIAAGITTALALAFLIVIAIGYVTGFADDYSRGWVLLWLLASVTIVLACRTYFDFTARHRAASGSMREAVALCGPAETHSAALSNLTERNREIDVVALFDTDGNPLPLPGTVLGRDALDIVSFLDRNAVDRLILTGSISEAERMTGLFPKLAEIPCEMQFLVGTMPGGMAETTLSRCGGLILAEIKRRPIDGWNGVAKSALDYTVAGISLLLLSPLLAAIAIAIKIDSTGPVFFRQRRHGFNNAVFQVWKFRTMHVLEDGPVINQAIRNDQRVTRVGRFLRVTSLDELPQLLNVLSGDMSLVGPRPHAVAHNEFYAEMFATYMRRHKVKPGITGWAQINGFRGPTADPELMRRRVEHDLEYIRKWSLWLDMKILFLTPLFGFTGRNAV
ncbi:MAG: undecaprenyl-phosphate glucose phosphotransferase [Hyphomicrobium sp.]|nr:undecaprenyl-phosphate glucose phosphotransferase [Hyphomicrobium sp.]